MLTPQEKKQLDKELKSVAIKYIGEPYRYYLLRVCVNFWENSKKSVHGIDSKTGQPWEMPKDSYLELWDKEIKKIRHGLKEKYGFIDKRGHTEMRYWGILPEALLQIMDALFEIKEKNPDWVEEWRPLGTEKERMWFFRTFKRYCIPESL